MNCEIHGGGVGNLTVVCCIKNCDWYERGLLHPFLDYDKLPAYLNALPDPMDEEGFVHISQTAGPRRATSTSTTSTPIWCADPGARSQRSRHAHRRNTGGGRPDRLRHPQRLHRLFEDDAESWWPSSPTSISDGRPVIGYGFNSNGRYGQGGLIRERFLPRIAEAEPDRIIDEEWQSRSARIWKTLMMTNEKPGGHGERSVAVGTIDMAIWDAVAKIEGKPLYRLLAERYRGGVADEKVWVYAAGGYYYPGKELGKPQGGDAAATATAATGS